MPQHRRIAVKALRFTSHGRWILPRRRAIPSQAGILSYKVSERVVLEFTGTGSGKNRFTAACVHTRHTIRPTSRTTCGFTVERSPSSVQSAQPRSHRGHTVSGTWSPTNPRSLTNVLRLHVPLFGKRGLSPEEVYNLQ
ncbi:hypothetical protein HPB49_005701 [Dermacentor silvarum]|uniref:Uncharacterized protein n=1 Tax=Dermacentor silvarum TaxID=543639 RepID=A0ACB8DN28_DERSI|nr:hypothetical protein HPB49_005701 [Dermacentor silvarum]